MFTTHEILLCLSLKYKGNWDEIYQAIRNKKRITEEEGRDLLASYNIYKRLKTEGLLLSEYPEEVPPNKENFPARNRLIAGLSEVVVVGEADRHSGTLITVNYALEEGKEVACLPYPADQDSACNLLIKDGATLITSAEDVLEML